MRSRTALWFECKIRYEKITDEGTQKKVTEQYTVDALSYAEAENRITEEMSHFISGEFEVTDIKKASYKEVFFSDDANADRYYRTKLDFITIDERTAAEKRSRVTYLVQASSLKNALKGIDEVMSSTMIDYDAASISDTKLVDVFEYGKGNEAEDKAAELIARMAEDVKDASLKVEDIVDRYVKTATPELRQQLIDKLTEMRKEKFGIE